MKNLKIRKAYSLKPKFIEVIDYHDWEPGTIIDAEKYFSTLMVETAFRDGRTETSILYSDVKHLFLNTESNLQRVEKIRELKTKIKELQQELYKTIDEMEDHISPKKYEELTNCFNNLS